MELGIQFCVWFFKKLILILVLVLKIRPGSGTTLTNVGLNHPRSLPVLVTFLYKILGPVLQFNRTVNPVPSPVLQLNKIRFWFWKSDLVLVRILQTIRTSNSYLPAKASTHPRSHAQDRFKPVLLGGCVGGYIKGILVQRSIVILLLTI